jgi:membrane peptidoglycan carboxypeptidase
VRPSALRRLSLREWTIAIGGALLIVGVVMLSLWTGRHAVAIYHLNRGVGGTMFYDAMGREWFPLDEQRLDVPFEQISPYFKDAVIAVEDHRYYIHLGIDPIAVTRAAVYNLRSSEGTQGGSTITQQLARNFFLTAEPTWRRKISEAFIAVILELRLTKEQIFTMYANEVYLGQRGSFAIHGFGEGSAAQFGKDLSKLTLPEAATLAGIIPAPNAYSPSKHPDRATSVGI